ncbi:MAG: choice-of-anchor D domain-containing protein [Candidatus Eisenbacteria bacterium]|uniref:Choice-of-anchor D domain-containing protein n=1 Tax=Eiseniibacteriota bacterium TaxID=2212470 RepID=A0A956N9J3_UNCEI|nr:choice-of-anchor D domain-containing protein [Candidatus Eisenbacteria bacterium]MCB9464762.1 choice-of-anchor D domain-containing protein [Candidatus Eisenbacteria bacterium]
MSTRTAGPSRFPQGLVVSSPFRAMSGTSPVLAVLVLALAAAPFVGPTAAQAQSVVDIFPTTSGAWGLEYHDGFLWMGDDTDGFIKKIDPSNGTVVQTLPTPYDQNHIANGANHGVAWDGTGFWVAGDFGKDFLYKVDLSGAFVDTIPTPTDAVGGLSWNGTQLVVTSYYPNPTAGILLVDPADGSTQGTIPTQGTQPYGIAYDFGTSTYWNGMDDLESDPERIWNLDGVGAVISSFETPNTSPKGVALGGGYMWVIANTIGQSGRSIFKIDLSGAGTPDITPVPAEQQFGIVALGSTETRNQILANDGDGDLVITSIATFAPFSFDSPTLPLTITPGNQASFNVYFDPTVAGNFQANLEIVSNDIDEGTLDVVLFGTGVPLDPTVLVTPDPLTFQDTGVGLVRDRLLTVQNRGFQDLNVVSVTSNDVQVRALGLPELPFPLATFEQLPVQVVLEPDAVGTIDAELSIVTNDPTNPVTVVSVSGDGILAEFAGGEPVWYADGIENVVTVQELPDLTGDGRPEAAMESYDAGASGTPLQTFFGNSHGVGVGIWQAGAGVSGGYGDQCLALGPDLNGDERPEVLRGTAWAGKRVEVRASTTGSLIWQYDTHVDDNGGWVYSVIAMPDVSGDGIEEVLAAAGSDGEPGTGSHQLYCFDGATGAVRFRQFSPDAFLSANWLEDVNGDGLADAIGGAGGNFVDDRVYCVSGASTGSAQLLWSASTGGSVWSLDAIEDVSGDGINDVIAGTWAPSVVCLDGTDGSVLWSHATAGEVIRVESIPDVTGDGHPDVVVAELANFFRVLDGMTGEMHWFFVTGHNTWSATWIPDVDDDGVVDIVAGAQTHSVYCVSGATGEQIWATNVGALVFSVRAVPDVTGNGTWDVLAGTQDLGSPGEGRIWCLEGGSVDPSSVDPTIPTFSGVQLTRVNPNPMRDWVTFSIDSGRDASGEVELDLFDASGRKVRTLAQDVVPGRIQMVWDGRSSSGTALPSGVYFYQLSGLTEDVNAKGRVTLIR